jgi:hypothetical protein
MHKAACDSPCETHPYVHFMKVGDAVSALDIIKTFDPSGVCASFVFSRRGSHPLALA